MRELSDVLQQHYIPSKMNPAGYASRGLSESGKEQVNVWFNDPELLWKSEFPWPKVISTKEVQDKIPEVIKAIKVNCLKVCRTCRKIGVNDL